MNIITKRVPREPTTEMSIEMRKVAESFGCEITPQFVQMLESVYTSAVSRAPDDPMESALEGILIERRGEAA